MTHVEAVKTVSEALRIWGEQVGARGPARVHLEAAEKIVNALEERAIDIALTEARAAVIENQEEST